MNLSRITTVAVYYKDGKPYSYSLFREGQEVDTEPVRGIEPDITSFDEAYELFSVIRSNFNKDGMPIDI